MTGPRSVPRSTAPVSAAPSDRSAVVTCRPLTTTEPWPWNAAAIRVSSGDAGEWLTIRVGAAGSARRPGPAGQDGAAHDRPEVRGGSPDRGQEPLRLADHLANRARPDRGQLAPEVLGEREREALDLLRRPGELGTQVLALAGDTGGTRVEVTLAGHVAADGDQHGRPERELLGADQRGNEEVPAGLQPAVGAQRDAVPHLVAQQDLVDLGEAELPWRADVLDRRQRRGTGPARVSGEMDVRRAGLGDARGDRADPAPSDQLDADPGAGVDRAQVGDQLRQVLDRIDVVVRWRADVALARLAAAQRRDVGRRLAPGQLAALAGLGALRDLDLELVGTGEVRGSHPEACRRHLLDLRVVAAPLRVGQVPRRILATLAGVRGAAGPLDPDRECLVRLGAQRTHAHRRDDEAAHDRARRLDLLERRRGRSGTADAKLVAREPRGRRSTGPSASR